MNRELEVTIAKVEGQIKELMFVLDTQILQPQYHNAIVAKLDGLKRSLEPLQESEEYRDKCEICGAEPMTTNCNNANCDA